MADRKVKESTPTSLTSIASVSLKEVNKFAEMLAALDPELWLIKNYLVRTNINSAIIPPIIDQLARINDGSGWGEVRITIRENKVIKVIGQDDKLLDLQIVFEKDVSS